MAVAEAVLPRGSATRRFAAASAGAALLVVGLAEAVAATKGPARFLVANDDASMAFPPSTASFYAIREDGTLAPPRRVSTGGNGMAGGYFGADRLLVVAHGRESCIFASNAQSESVAAFDAVTHRLLGVFRGSHEDTSLARDGIGLAAGGDRVYAAFSGSGNIGAFRIAAGCQLQFLGDAGMSGLSGGTVESMAIRGNVMVVAYGDGSIESLEVSGPLPVSHHDAIYAAGRDDDFAPDAVDMTSDGRYAIFGGSSTSSSVEVADLSTGKIGAIGLFHLGTGWNSGGVRLSPDETMLYLSNSSGGRVTAAFFDKATGKVRPGCTSDPLRGFYRTFTTIGAVATELPEGTGSLLYVPEFDAGGNSSIGILRFASSPGACTLRETAQSPVAAGPNSALLSIAVYPCRKF